MRIETPQTTARRHARWLTVILGAAFGAILFAQTAQAYNCDDNGTPGWLNGTTADDAGCITQAEYEVMYSIENLEDVGVFVDNGDGTVTFPSGAVAVIENDPLDRPVSATPVLEPEAPTVREVLFPFDAGFSLLPA